MLLEFTRKKNIRKNRLKQLPNIIQSWWPDIENFKESSNAGASVSAAKKASIAQAQSFAFASDPRLDRVTVEVIKISVGAGKILFRLKRDFIKKINRV